MLTVEELQGQWTTIRGKLKEKWGQLTDDDLQIVAGNVEQMIGRIQQRTGAEKRAIEDFIGQLTQSDSPLAHAKEVVADYAHEAGQRIHDGAEKVREGYEQVSTQAKEGYQNAERIVRQRPFESLAAVFATGLITGAVVGLLLRSEA